MKHLLSLVTILILSITPLIAQSWVWGLKATGNSQNSEERDIAVDNNGNSVIAGYYQKSMILDGHTLTSTDDYYSDIFLGSLDANGKVKWLISIEAGNSYDYYIGIKLDDDKNIYLTGADNGYIFVSKYDSTGVLIWHNNFNYKCYGYGRDVSIDQYDNVYVIGGSGGDFFTAKLNYYGKTVWTKDIRVNSSNGFSMNDIDVDAKGNIYFAGAFAWVDSIKLDDIVIKQKGSTFWGKMNTDGKFLWAKAALGSTDSKPRIALTPDNNVYICGSFYNTLTIGSTSLLGLCCSNPKPYIAKYDTDGNYKWARTANTTYESKGSINDIKVDNTGNIYLTGGYFTCYGTFCTESDYFIEEYNNLGNILWRKEFKNAGGDGSQGIDIDNKGFIYNIGVTMADNFIDQNSSSSIYSMGVGKLNTLASTTKRPERPIIDRLYFNCKSNELATLTAKGQNVKWYDNSALSNLIHSGELYEKEFQSTDTLYVTQTINDVESWPKEVIVYKTDFNNETIKYHQDTLFVNQNDYLSYKWSYNGIPIESTNRNYYIPLANGMYSVELIAGNCSATLNYSFDRPERPKTDSLKFVCYNEPVGILNTVGQNVIWYGGNTYQDTVFVGNQYSPVIKANKTYYVRQTVNGIASYPSKVVVKFSELKDSILHYGPDYMYFTDNKKQFRYQWYYENTLIENANANLYKPLKDGLYSVNINDSICNKTISHYFIMQPKISATQYKVCRNDSMPILNSEGEDIMWYFFNNTGGIDTLGMGNSYKPANMAGNQYIYLVRSKNGFTSYPIIISILKSKFSDVQVIATNYSLNVQKEDAYNYTYQWYYKQDTVPLTNSYYLSNPYFGEYKVKVVFNYNCDSTLNYSYYPVFDSIVYICDNSNPSLSIGSYNMKWYSDEALTKVVSSNYYFYPYLYGKDSTFYVAQLRDNKAIWKQKIKIIYTALNKLSITNTNNILTINKPKAYHRYIWKLGDTILDNKESYCIPDINGTYSVRIIAGSCFYDLTYPYIRNALNDVYAEGKFKIYPNPVRDKFSIACNDFNTERIQLKLYSLNGQLMLEKQYNEKEIKIDMSLLYAGIYMLELRTVSKVLNYKIIKL